MIIYNCTALLGSGAYCSDSSAPSFIDCQFITNGTTTAGGGIYVTNGAAPYLSNCVFKNNFANLEGGGAWIGSAGRILMQNCLFYGNSSPRGSIMAVYDTDMDVINCTFANNKGDESGIFLWSNNAALVTSLRIKNSIISHNDTPEPVITYSMDTTVILLTYTNISDNNYGNWTGFIQGQQILYGNMSEDPLYVDLDDNDYHLTSGSPCIDAGDPTSPPDPDQTIADMGAFYFHQSGVGIDKLADDCMNVNVYPNPFTNYTTFSYTLDLTYAVTIRIFNTRGHLIKEIAQVQQSGKNNVKWDARGLPPGLYYYRITYNSGRTGRGKILKY